MDASRVTDWPWVDRLAECPDSPPAFDYKCKHCGVECEFGGGATYPVDGHKPACAYRRERERPTTICVACRWHQGPGLDGEDFGAWSDHHCVHPEAELLTSIDPVTGEPGVKVEAELGPRYLDPQYNCWPFCCMVNDGSCRWYEAKAHKETSDDERTDRPSL